MLECLINHYSDGNQAQFAAKLGIPAQNVNAWLKRNTYNAELIYSKCEGVSADWLLSGEGRMLIKQQNVDAVNAASSSTDKELIDLCKLLVANYQQRDDVMNKLISMVKKL